MKIVITESHLNRIIQEMKDDMIKCTKCEWEWKKSEGGKTPYTCHKCGHVNKEEEIDERSRSFAFTRKKRLFSKPERMSNPLRYKPKDRLGEDDNEIRLGSLTDKQVKSIDDLNKDAKFLKCKACRKLYTQTTHKKKKSLPICPWCGKHN
jgi:transcription initiation factor TFIIIB Brf1 subunit/transcription initiation factor TFIIB